MSSATSDVLPWSISIGLGLLGLLIADALTAEHWSKEWWYVLFLWNFGTHSLAYGAIKVIRGD